MKREEVIELEEFCKESRRITVKQIASLGLGHIGGALSMVELSCGTGKIFCAKRENKTMGNRTGCAGGEGSDP